MGNLRFSAKHCKMCPHSVNILGTSVKMAKPCFSIVSANGYTFDHPQILPTPRVRTKT